MPQFVVDNLKAINVYEEKRQVPTTSPSSKQFRGKTTLKKGTIRQSRKWIVIGPVSEQFIVAEYLCMPAFEFFEQRVEIVSKLVQFSNRRWLYPILELLLAPSFCGYRCQMPQVLDDLLASLT